MTAFYSRWSPAWDRIGWSTTPQYAGQCPVTRDFLPVCGCSARFVRVTAVLIRHDDGRHYEGTCAKGHVIPDWPVQDLIAADPALLLDTPTVAP